MVSLSIHSGSHYLRMLIFLSHFLSRLPFPECIGTHRTGSWLILPVMQTLLSATNTLQIINIPDSLMKNEELIWWMPNSVHVPMLLVLWSIIWKIKQKYVMNQIHFSQWSWCKSFHWITVFCLGYSVWAFCIWIFFFWSLLPVLFLITLQLAV